MSQVSFIEILGPGLMVEEIIELTSEPVHEVLLEKQTVIEYIEVQPPTNGSPGTQGPQGPAGAKGDKGDTGLTGPQGPVGPTGPQGNIGLTGPQGPAGTNGTNGADGATGATGVTGPQGPAGPTGPQGPVGPTGPKGDTGNTGAAGANGTNGLDGKTVRNGTGVPSNSLGVDGDFYIDTASSFMYGPKAGGVYPAGFSIIGPAGSAGSTGATGAAGAAGVTTKKAFTYTKSLALNGTSQYVDLGDTLNFERTDAFSISAWVYQTSITGTQTIVGRKASAISAGWQLVITSGRAELYIISSNSNQIRSQPNASFNFVAGQFNHIFVSYDGSSSGANGVRWLINGMTGLNSNNADNLTASTLVSGATARIGAINTTVPNYFNGNICQLGIYNKVISVGQAYEIYRVLGTQSLLDIPGSSGSLVHYWRLGDDDTAPTVLDSVANGAINGSIAGSAAFATSVPQTDASLVFKSFHPSLGGELVEDFIGVAPTWRYGWQTFAVNSGSVDTLSQPGNEGQARLQTNALANGCAVALLGQNALDMAGGVGGCNVYWEARVGYQAFPDTTNDWISRFGIFTAANGTSPGNGIWFEWDRSTSTFWQCKTALTSVVTTTVTTVTASTAFTVFRIEFNAAGTLAIFKINGQVVATSSTNLPLSSQNLSVACFVMNKTAGTGSRIMYVDWLTFKWIIT